MKQMTIARKITLIVVSALFFIIVVGTSGNITTRQMAERSTDMYEKSLLPLSWINQIESNDNKHNALLLELMFNTDKTLIDGIIQNIQETQTQTNELLQKYRSVSLTADEAAALSQYDELLAQYEEQKQQILDYMTNDQVPQAYSYYTEQSDPTRDQMSALLSQLADSAEAAAIKMNEESQVRAGVNNLFTVIVTLAALLLLIPIAYIITRMITKPVRSLQQLMVEAEKGNMSVQGTYASKDEIGQLTHSFNGMIDGIRGLLHKVNESTQTLNSSSEELTASVHQTSGAADQIAGEASGLAIGFDNQARSIEELSEAADHMVDRMEIVESIGKEMQKLAGEAEQANKYGVAAARSIHEQMVEIKQTVEETEAGISALNALSKQIGSIVTTINEIAGQTNLLSLNASIEAARAGEAGRGFTVVAGEIRKLSDDAAVSSRQIAELISTIQARTEAAVQLMKRGAEQVALGTEKSQDASESFAAIETAITDTVHKVNETEEAIADIVGQTRLMAASMQRVNTITHEGEARVQHMSAASEEQAAAMEDVSHSAQTLAVLADDLHTSMMRFKL